MSTLTIQSIELQTERLLLRSLRTHDAFDLLRYYRLNKDHLRPWEPLNSDDCYTLQKVKQKLAARVKQMKAGNAIHLLLICKKIGILRGECNFTNIVRGPFQACYLGFSIDQDSQGKGIMYEALKTAIDFVFKTYGLHRVMANYCPDNKRSKKLLAHLGFEIEGRAKSYLKINGLWKDHILTSRINRIA